MSNKNLFEVAARNKLRFPFRGSLSVEDLWDLTPQDLDSIFKTLSSQLKQAKEDSLLKLKTEQDEVLDTKIEIVRYIVKVKLDEMSERAKVADKAAQKQKIMKILSTKESEELHNKSPEELKRMLDELG